MKLLKLTLEGTYKGLRDQTFDFSRSTENIITFVGMNGSGKSQLLELIAEVFSYLERLQRSEFRIRNKLPFSFVIEYQIRPYLDGDTVDEYRISSNLLGNIESDKLLDEQWDAWAFHEVELPQHIVGYASGLNENLQRSFLKNTVQYFDVMSVRSARRKRLAKDLDEIQIEKVNQYYLNRYPGIFGGGFGDVYDESGFGEVFEKDTNIPGSIFLDYDCNALLMTSLAVLSKEEIDEIFPEIPYRYPQNITIQYNLRNTPIEEDAIRDLSQLITIVGNEAIIGIGQKTSDEEYDLYGLDYLAGEINIDLTIGGVQELLSEKYYGLPIRLFEKLYKIQLLGVSRWKTEDKKSLRHDDFFDTVKKPLKGKLPLSVSKLKLSDGNNTIDFDDLSDGEAQLVQVLSAGLVFSPENTLFLFDEPETHLNPSWRTYFHKHLSKAINNSHADTNRMQVLLSTHSPFLVSSMKKENVLRFERNENGVVMYPVDSETYGSSFDVLIKNFFGLKSLISQTAVDDIRKHLHEMQLSNEEKIAWLNENVGDSMEKAYLLRRLQE